MDVDSTAPAVARSEIEVAASPEMVWGGLTDIRRWLGPGREVGVVGRRASRGNAVPLEVGAGTITSTLRSVEPPHLIAWTGTTFGIRAIHVYRLERRGDTTIVTSEESGSGLLVRLLRRSTARGAPEGHRLGTSAREGRGRTARGDCRRSVTARRPGGRYAAGRTDLRSASAAYQSR